MLISMLVKHIGIGILIGGLFYFLALTFMLYLNGRELKDYYLVLFGKMSSGDIILSSILIITITIYYTISYYPSILIDIESHKWKMENIDNKPWEFNINLNIDDRKISTIDVTERMK